MLIEDVEQLQTWLTATLSLISEADPTALAKYVTALVKRDEPAQELKTTCIELLDIFLQRNTERFVEKLFNVLENNSYIVKPVQPLIIRNKKWKRKPRPSTARGRKPQYRKVSPVTVSGNNQQYRKPCPVTVSVNNQQYRKPSPVTVSGNNQQFRQTSPVTVSGNNQLYRKSSPVSVSGNNQQYRKPSPVSVSVNNQQFRRTSPVTVSGNNQQYRKASSVTVSGNNQQFRKASPVTVSGNNQQYRKGSTVTVFGNNQQYRKASPVTISVNNQQFRKASPVSVSWNNQQYRKPSPVTVSGNNQQYRKACPVTVSGNNQQFRKPSPVTVSGNNQQYRKVSPVTVSGNNQQYRKPSPSACSSPGTKYQNRKPSPSTAQEIKCQKRKSSPSTYTSPETKRQNRKPSPLSDSIRNQQQSKYNQVPFVNKKGKYTKVIPENALRPVSPVVSRNRDVNSACDRRIVKLYPDSRIETLQSISSTDMEKPTSGYPYLDTRSKDLGNDWLDYIEMQEMFEHTAVEDVEELLCFRKKGRGCMEPQHVPRLPLKATIQRMMSDDLSASGHSGRGRARLLQNRAKASKPQGLHKKSTERLKADEKREVIRPPFVIRSQIDSIENVYTQQWQQEEFPRLLRAEDTNNGSPKKLNKKALNVAKQTKSEARKHQEDLGEEITSGTDLLTQSFEQEVNHIPEAKKVNTAKAAKKKFDFSKANQELLQEFPIVKNSGPKIFSLTQQNLERFLRESDSESCSSQENSCVSHNANEEIIERMPVYQRYAVTLDDIRKSKSSKVPPKVKGCLADLLEAMDAYCENPETYFDKRNKESDNLNLVPNEKDSVTIETADKKHDTLTFNNDLKISDIELRNAEAVTNPQSNENIDDTLSNVSVVSDISSLNSPSENELEINDDIVKDMNESLESSHVKSNHINQKFDIGKGLNSEIVMGNNEMCNKKEINGTCDGAKLTAGKHQSSIVKGEMFVNELNVKTEKEVRTKSEHCYCLEKAVSIRSLDEIDLKTPPVPKSTDKDMKGFQKVGSKQKKAKLPSDVKKTINGVSNDQTIWRIYGRNAIQVDGLPANCDISELHGMVSGFGTVVDFQVRIINKATSVRFRLHNEDACEYAVQCLDQTDCLFPECNCKLSCHQLQT